MSQYHPKLQRRISRRQFLQWSAGAAGAAVIGGGMPTFGHSGMDQDQSSTISARVIRHVHTEARKVCLSYDDCWSEHFTWLIGKAFHKNNIRLTYFPAGRAVTNNIERPIAGYEEMYRRLHDMGHEFGCHLYTHRDIKEFGLQQLVEEEMEPSLRALRRAFGPGFKPVGIRPPFGVVTDAMRELSNNYGLPIIMWGLDSQDAICARYYGEKCPDESQRSYDVYSAIRGMSEKELQCSKVRFNDRCVDKILETYEAYMRPGTIILHHALESSYLAIQRILTFLSDWNLQPVRLSELLTYG